MHATPLFSEAQWKCLQTVKEDSIDNYNACVDGSATCSIGPDCSVTMVTMSGNLNFDANLSLSMDSAPSEGIPGGPGTSKTAIAPASGTTHYEQGADGTSFMASYVP